MRRARIAWCPHAQQVPYDTLYRGTIVGEHRLDLVVAGRVVVEVKAAERLHPQHAAQLISYLRATGLELGLLINFGAPLLRSGIRRVVLTEESSSRLALILASSAPWRLKFSEGARRACAAVQRCYGDAADDAP